MESEKSSRLTDDQWRYLAWLSVVVGTIAVGAIIAVWVGAATRTPEAERVAATSTTTTTMTTDPESLPSAIELINTPVVAPVVIDDPRIGAVGRYHRDGGVVMVRITGDECERSGGTIRVGGTIRNESKLGQSFDYVISLEIRRPLTGSVLADFETTIESVGPGETAEWSVEETASKVTTVQCIISELKVIPEATTSE